MDKWGDDTRLMAHVLTDKVPDSYLTWYEERRKEENAALPHGFSHRAARPNSLKVLAPYWLDVLIYNNLQLLPTLLDSYLSSHSLVGGVEIIGCAEGARHS